MAVLPPRVSMTRFVYVAVCVGIGVCLPLVALAQQPEMEDVIRNLRKPDAEAEFSALETLRHTRYVEALKIAPLINDPVEQIQLSAIATELSFYLVDDVPARKRLRFVVEKEIAPQAFDRGPLAAWPSTAPPELTDALLKAIDDKSRRVRVEAIYSFGVIARPPLRDEDATRLIAALDHDDAAIRAGAARVVGRLQVKSAGDKLIKALNDSSPQVRYSAMRALGEIREERAIGALTDQLKYYSKGEGAWSALDALARIGHASSVPLFKSRLSDKDEYLRRAAAEGLGRTGDTTEIATLQTGATTDPSPMARAAMTFAMQRLGQNYLPRLVDVLTSARLTLQIQEYLLELGEGIVPDLLPRLKEPTPEIRAGVAEILGALGDASTVPALEPLTKDTDRTVAGAATEAIARIGMTGKEK
jgi:HEAT repeat protein